MQKYPSTHNVIQYKQCQNKLNHSLEKVKKQYYKILIDVSSHNSGLMWKTINDIIKNKNKSPSKLVNTSGQNTLTNPQSISEEFNDYFSNIAKTLADIIPRPNKDFNCRPSYLIHGVKTSFFMQQITKNEVLLELQNLNSS